MRTAELDTVTTPTHDGLVALASALRQEVHEKDKALADAKWRLDDALRKARAMPGLTQSSAGLIIQDCLQEAIKEAKVALARAREE